MEYDPSLGGGFGCGQTFRIRPRSSTPFGGIFGRHFSPRCSPVQPVMHCVVCETVTRPKNIARALSKPELFGNPVFPLQISKASSSALWLGLRSTSVVAANPEEFGANDLIIRHRGRGLFGPRKPASLWQTTDWLLSIGLERSILVRSNDCSQTSSKFRAGSFRLRMSEEGTFHDVVIELLARRHLYAFAS